MLKKQLLQFFQKIAHEKQSMYNWHHHARPSQLPPMGNWNTWLILAGRGFGKTRAGSETIRSWVCTQQSKRIALIGQSLQEVRSVMVEGKSGLLAVSAPHERPIFEPSKNQLRWPCGALATLYGADYYEKLRGPEFDTAWVDELAKFRYVQEFWEQLQLSLRLAPARCIVTTTPRPIPLLTQIINDPRTVLTKGNTFENSANLSHTFLAQIKAQFDNTRLGQQELYAELLSEQQGALWSRSAITYQTAKDEFKRVVIAIDPATTHHAQSDETGIVIAALGHDNCVYVLDDISGRFSPNSWGEKVAKAYSAYGADRVVAEINKGGDLVEGVLKTVAPHISYRPVRATRGKYTRAEPVAALYEQKKVFHTKPFIELETQMCTYVPGVTTKSPDRMDALVWAVTSLMLESESRPVLKLWNE